MGILGNERVDEAANATSSLHYVSPQLLPTKKDFTLLIKQLKSPTGTSIGETNPQITPRPESNPT